MKNYLEITLFFYELSEVEMKAIKHWIRNTIEGTLADFAIDILESDRKEVELMVANNAFILKEMRENSKAEGKIEGREEGLKEGLEEGRKEEKINIAKKLLDILDDETIALKTELPIEVIQDLRK